MKDKVTNNIIPSIKPISKKRLVVFKGIAIMLPFILFILLEILFRIIGVGLDVMLFQEDKDNKDFMEMNSFASEKFFSDPINATRGNHELFQKRKASNTFRMFVLGESTTIGYPYMHNGSFHRWLQYRLMHTYPEINFEIINVSLTAVNSYTVLEFGKEVLHYQPDAVLIYTGHNEYYGALGVGSTSQISNNPFIISTVLKLRELRLTQVIQRAIFAIKKIVIGKGTDVSETLMKRMASDQYIPLNSEIFKRGVLQFETNINKLCRLYSEKKIPVFISNLVSNEKDIKPFISDNRDTLNSAGYYYNLAVKEYENGNFDKAKLLFIKAKELDMLRFRSPEAMNRIINAVTKKYQGIFLVDSKDIFEQNSPHQILSNTTLLEHVHPNLYGYALMSDAFYNALRLHQLPDKISKQEMPFSQLLQQMPVTAVDSLYGVYDIRQLKNGWPFSDENLQSVILPGSVTEEEKIAEALIAKKISWNDAMDQLMNYYLSINNHKAAQKVAEAVALEYPYDFTFSIYAGKFCLEEKEYEKSIVYFQKAFAIHPSIDIAKNLYDANLSVDKPTVAINYVDYAIRSNPRNAELLQIKANLKELIEFKKNLPDSSSSPLINAQIANHYKLLGNKEMFAKYSEKSF